ncbi:hypothetical protein HUT17_05130 (plasmid) [Nocardiopsis flavescens]|nr:hypothetical protein HUT17_05130 [Nocardiopsis flavescens]
MTLLHLVLVVPLAGATLILLFPQVLWKMQAWQYRTPEAVRPSRLWLLTQQVGSVALIVLCLVTGVVTWEPGATGPQPASEQEESSAEPAPEDQPFDTEYSLLQQPNISGAILKYEQDGPQTLVVTALLGRCHDDAQPLTGYVEESEDSVTVHLSYLSAEDTCLVEEVQEASVALDLAEPLGDRSVQDRNGQKIRLGRQPAS